MGHNGVYSSPRWFGFYYYVWRWFLQYQHKVLQQPHLTPESLVVWEILWAVILEVDSTREVSGEDSTREDSGEDSNRVDSREDSRVDSHKVEDSQDKDSQDNNSQVVMLVVVLQAAVVGAAPHRARPTAVKAPMNLSLLLSPSKVSALLSVHHALQQDSDSLPVLVPVMVDVQALTSAASTLVCSTTPANHLLALEENKWKTKYYMNYFVLDIC